MESTIVSFSTTGSVIDTVSFFWWDWCLQMTENSVSKTSPHLLLVCEGLARTTIIISQPTSYMYKTNSAEKARRKMEAADLKFGLICFWSHLLGSFVSDRLPTTRGERRAIERTDLSTQPENSSERHHERHSYFFIFRMQTVENCLRRGPKLCHLTTSESERDDIKSGEASNTYTPTSNTHWCFPTRTYLTWPMPSLSWLLERRQDKSFSMEL